MTRAMKYRHEFVDAFPEPLENGVLYVSVEFGSAAHRCLCGCGSEVYTRLSPKDWVMVYDGETVSLDPSIGNWSFPCQSHYWLERGRVSWAEQWSSERIERGRALDRTRKARDVEVSPSVPVQDLATKAQKPIIRLFAWLFR